MNQTILKAFWCRLLAGRWHEVAANLLALIAIALVIWGCRYA